MIEPTCYYQCKRRFAGCHGKNPDGSWRCEDYRKLKMRNAAQLAARAARIAAENDVEASKKAMRRRA